MRTLIIAEAGVNHNGDPDLALRLVEAAARCGADAVKFQTFSADKLVRRGAGKAAYQLSSTGPGDQYSMLKPLEMSPALHAKLFEHCADNGIEFMSTPFDESAVRFLLALGMSRIKVASGELTNEPFLRFLGESGAPLILSTGMGTMAEVIRAVQVISEARSFGSDAGAVAGSLTILHCTSNYPARYEDVNLRAMRSIAEVTGLPVGYSDHTPGVAVSAAAVAMGACIIEKHITLDKAMPGPDHSASLEPAEFAQLVGQIRAIELALGSEVKAPSESELAVRTLVRRSVTATRTLDSGRQISASDVQLLRPGDGIPPAELPQVLGRVLRRDVQAGETLKWSDLE